MRNHIAKHTPLCVFVLIMLIISSCGAHNQQAKVQQTATSHMQMTPTALPIPTETPQVGQLNPDVDQLTRAVLINIREHGWNPNAMMRGKVVGGLFINWKMDDPSQTNALKQGSDDATAGSHDPQVDLYYLNALAEYDTLHPQDQSFAADTHKALAQVTFEFTNYNLPKGWIYFYLLRSGMLLHNQTLVNEAHTAAANYFTHWYAPAIGIVYNSAHAPGIYNVEHTLNCGAALIDAGTRWQQPTWTQAGKSTINHTLTTALDPVHHLFYNNVIVEINNQQHIQNDQAKPSTQGNGVQALITAYRLTHIQHYMDVAGQVLQAMFASSLWDQTNGGLFFALDLDSNHLEQSYKETRGQTLSLIGLYRYNQTLSTLGQPQLLLDKQTQLINVLSKHFYQSTYHGFFYRVTPTFQVYQSHPGTGIGLEDYFTTEAMGTALDALQQTEFAQLSV